MQHQVRQKQFVYAEKEKAVARFRNCLISKVGHLGLEPRTSRL